MVVGLRLDRDLASSSDIGKEIGVELLRCCLKRSQLRCFGHLKDVSWSHSYIQLGEDPRADPEHAGGTAYPI